MVRFEKVDGGKKSVVYEVCSDLTLSSGNGLSASELHTDPDFAPYYEWSKVTEAFPQHPEGVAITVAYHWENGEAHYVIGPGGLEGSQLSTTQKG